MRVAAIVARSTHCQRVEHNTIVVGQTKVGDVDQAASKVADHAQAFVGLALHVSTEVDSSTVGINTIDALQLTNARPRLAIVVRTFYAKGRSAARAARLQYVLNVGNAVGVINGLNRSATREVHRTCAE